MVLHRERRFGRALAAFPRAAEVEVVFRPYQLDPGAPEAAVPVAEYLARRFGDRASGIQGQVSAVAADEGITMNWDIALTANTRTAHRLLRLAEQEYGAAVQRALGEKLFELHFTLGGNVADHEQLADAAVAVGMERGRVQAYLASQEGMKELEAEFAAARELGIRAVPTFVIDGRYAVQGAQPAAKFLEALEEVARRRRRRARGRAIPARTGRAPCETRSVSLEGNMRRRNLLPRRSLPARGREGTTLNRCPHLPAGRGSG